MRVPIARVFTPLTKNSRYKAAWGGRGSGKSHYFAGQIVEDSIYKPGLRTVCIREVQKSLKESAKKLIETKIQEFNVGHLFDVQDSRIKTPGGGLIIFQGMQDHNAESIKSLEGFDRAWCEEAQTLSETSLRLLRPTIRSPGSELWFSWNPRLKTDPVDEMFRQSVPPTGSIVVKANWNDNPWFPDELEQERIDCLNNDPDQYDHIWEGGYITVSRGAYFSKNLVKTRAEGKITKVEEDPLLTVRLFCDIGGTGQRADNFVFVAAQFVGKAIHSLDHYEVQGQPVGAHLDWLRSKGYTKERAQIWLPHDGETNDRVFDVSYESAFKKAGYHVEVIPNQGKGAAKQRIEALRNVFNSIWFDEEKCKGAIEALGWYHEKRDTHRNIGLGPNHDWSSHTADAYGLMAIVRNRAEPDWKPIKYKKVNYT